MSLGPLLFAAALGQLAAILASRRVPRLWLGLTVASAAAALLACGTVLFTGAEWDWRGGLPLGGHVLHLRMDALSALFGVLLAIVETAGAIYAREYWADRAHPQSGASGRMWWSTLVLALGVVITVSNGLHFLMGWELFAVSAFFLVTLNRQNPEVRAAGALYLNASHVATLSLFAFFALLASHTGSWDLGPMRDRPELAPLFWLALFGFGLKAGAFPLHIWLPSAHANAPSHVSAMLSGFTIKIGIYGLLRFSGWLPQPAGAGWAIAALGLASAVLGVAFALGQHDLKRLLAYHSVENIGIILIGLGFGLIALQQGDPTLARWGRLAVAGALLHVWNHGLFKSLLFLGAGSVLHATGTREMSRLGGLWRTMPWTASLFALGAVAISGLPPLNGFVSEWLIYLGLFDGAIAHGPAAWATIPGAILLGVTGALALACFVKVCAVVFLGAPRTSAATHAHECGARMRGPMIVLAAGCLVIGLAPLLFWPALDHAITAWQPGAVSAAAPSSLFTLGWAQTAVAVLALAASVVLWRRLRQPAPRALTWDCGYAEPTARMQYTAGSFAGTITEWFAWILRPQRHVEPMTATFPARAHFEEHTPETVLTHLIEPLARVVARFASLTRRLQHGHLQSYLLYLLVGLAALGGLTMIGGAQ
ncbi:proton-conducting transporter membrane subunit [Opitutus sp. ER46]|uniref:proton-conducting transporter transmembrane domain-containing protein n=1 Tax=Opitutus sp. ER46 TaxID=2161864 RepID=UPI000D3148BE|nr:proton-conducting transporter membrane subunit [Opitutus sp. ER46]PTX91293.1 NADH-quinone oxidoreductase subunit H [Opitutus sp. ER46]